MINTGSSEKGIATSTSTAEDRGDDTRADTDEEKPIVEVEKSTAIKYASNPLKYSIIFILILDFLERFAFNGIIFTMPGYLTGYYQPNWNPNFAPWEANSFIALSQGIGYVAPFVVAIVADAFIGDYWSINLFTGLFYIPGAFLIASAAIPYANGNTEFPFHQLRIGTHILFPIGFGAAKTLYGVYCAKQYDPVKQADQIGGFFVLYTGVEFLGSFIGALVSILIAELLKNEGEDVVGGEVIAEFLNASAITLGLITFIIGSRRYVNGAVMRDLYVKMCRSLCGAILCYGGPSGGCSKPGFEKTKQSKGGNVPDSIVTGMVQVLLLVMIYLLLLPLNIAFTQGELKVNVIAYILCVLYNALIAFLFPLRKSLLLISLWLGI